MSANIERKVSHTKMKQEKPNEELGVAFNKTSELKNDESETLHNTSKEHRPKQITLEIDEVLRQLGGFGRWQWMNFLLLSLPAMVSGFVLLTYSFTGFKPETYRCMIPECDDENSTFNFGTEDDISNSSVKSIFGLEENGDINYCKTYPYNPISDNKKGSAKCSLSNFNFNATPMECDASHSKLIYEKFAMDSSIVTEFNLFCNEEYKIALTGTIYMVGLFFGALILGRLSDMVGRRISISLSILAAAIVQVAGGLAQNYATYAVTRFLAGMVVYGSFSPAFNLILEIVGPNYKTRVGMGMNIAFAVGCSGVGLAAWLIPDWRHFHYFTSIPIFAMCLLHFLIPESPRWLLAKHKYKDLYRLVRRIAKMNRVVIPVEIEASLLEAMSFDQVKQKSYYKKTLKNSSSETQETTKQPIAESQMSHCFTNPTLRIITLVLFANWAIVVLGYYGISMASSKLGSNSFVSTVLAALTEVPAYFFVMFVMDHWGRKPLCCFSFMLTGIICIPAGFAHGNLQLVLALLGKFGASAAFGLLYLYTAELYPTELRGTGNGLCCMMARIGGFLAPQVALLLRKDLAMIVMGICSFIGGLLSLLLPETLGTILCEKMEDLEDLKRDGKPFFAWWTKQKLQNHLDVVLQRKSAISIVSERC